MSKGRLSVSLFVALLFATTLAAGLNISRVVAAPPVVDGIISPGEYDGGMAVQLVGPYPPGAPFPPWTTDAYIDWDTEYLYVAVNESVPLPGPMGVKHSWIEFLFDAPATPYYHAFVLFDDGTPQYVHYPKPGGGWSWDTWPFPWWATTNTATEFKFKYTDFGITFGDTIKMCIDRGKDDFLYMPLGECSVWPNPCIFYPTSDASTWGDVTLDHAPPPPPPPTHVMDGVIGSGEYDGGMAVQLVGRTDPTWTVDAYIDWDTEYLYVAVNEPVPATTGHNSWIEFTIDAGPARPYLDAFALFDDGFFTHVQCPKPPGGWGWVPYSFLAASGTATEFRIKYADFGISLGDTIKMSIDRNQGPAPPPPYGFAAFWPQNAIVYFTPPDPTSWGDVYLAPPPTPSVSLTVVSAYNSPNPSGTTLYTPGTSVTASVTSPVAGPAGTQYVCTGWTGTGDVPSSGTEITVTFTINQDSGITWNWNTQHYLTVTSAYDTPTGQGWYDSGSTASSSVTSPVSGGTGIRYVATGYTGTGNAPASDSGTSVSFTITSPSSVTWNWNTQHYLTVKTDPPGIATIPGEDWYDIFTTVTLTAPPVTDYVFSYWDVNGVSQGSGVNPITVQVECEATAHYTAAPPPPPARVGGEWAPISTVQFVSPWIILALLAIATAGTASHRLLKKHW